MLRGASGFFRTFLLPGLVFQSVVIAGGYGTGRELVEYFLANGPAGGLLGMAAVTLVVWALLLALTFEFARTFRAYDYRSLFRALLGRFWVAFEMLYLVLLLIVLAVVGAAAGVLLRDGFGVPYAAGVALTFAVVGFLAFEGSRVIERVLSVVSVLLYLVFGVFLVLSIARYGGVMRETLAEGITGSGWVLDAFKYALYNIAVIPAVLFSVRGLERRRDAIVAGLIAGVAAVLPGLLILLALVPHYPSIVPEEVPVVAVLQQLDVPLYLDAYRVVLFGALITTGIGFIHAVNERVESACRDHGRIFPPWARMSVAVGLLLVGLALSAFGLIALVAQGYGAISYGVFFVFALPMSTVGIYRIATGRGSRTERGDRSQE